eukprot:scaffold350035_cov23-Prasinocladus_malaysianus.AAC.1
MDRQAGQSVEKMRKDSAGRTEGERTGVRTCREAWREDRHNDRAKIHDRHTDRQPKQLGRNFRTC